MSKYIGYNTIDLNTPRRVFLPETNKVVSTASQQAKTNLSKFQLTDFDLIHRDILNAFSIKQGEKVGNPAYGTTLWNYLFEPQVSDVVGEIVAEVRRVIAQDNRIILNDVAVSERDNGILIAVELAVRPFNEPKKFGMFLNRNNGTIRQLSM